MRRGSEEGTIIRDKIRGGRGLKTYSNGRSSDVFIHGLAGSSHITHGICVLMSLPHHKTKKKSAKIRYCPNLYRIMVK